MNNVFILGAGASKQSGAPLMRDFFDKAEGVFNLYNLKHFIDNINIQNKKLDYDRIIKSKSEMQSIYSKSNIDLHNIENFFGIIEMAKILGDSCNWKNDSLEKLEDSLKSIIIETLSFTIKFPFNENVIHSPVPYENFIREINSYIHTDDNNSTFITFNYDLSLDYALHKRYEERLSYFLEDESPDDNKIPLLKLHGSLNWMKCANSECEKIIAIRFGDFNDNLPTIFSRPSGNNPSMYKYLLIDKLLESKNCPHCNQALKGYPLLVPPTSEKSPYHKEIKNVWKKASKVLADADNIFVIGYSLPDTDLFFKFLYSLGTMSENTIKRFIVYDPDPKVHERFRDFMGGMVKDRFIAVECDFNTAIHGKSKSGENIKNSIKSVLYNAYNL